MIVLFRKIGKGAYIYELTASGGHSSAIIEKK
jgi:hypothetical protein